MNKNKVCLISLGCEKNLVDSEMILGLLKKGYIEIVNNQSQANIIIVNTCGFINSAKEEAINTIFDVLEYKKNGTKIVVTGCLVQRYLNDLKESLPDVDLWIPLKDYYKFGDLIKQVINDDTFTNMCLNMNIRLLSTPKHLAYVRISDGCNNRCTYCAIPLIRGDFVSRSEEEIVTEIKKHINDGRKEICLISQDLSNYGYDINSTLANLLRKIVKIDGLKWLRLLYLYPDEITEDFIDVVKNNDKILPYFDIPLQHASNKILGYMHRRGKKDTIIDLITKIRKEIPNAVIRTTMIVGFPHESQKDFDELIDFVSLMRFNHLGAFTYSKEEDTLSYSMNNQVPSRIKTERLNKLMDTQRWISLSLNKECINKTFECIIESFDDEKNMFYGRTYAFAPDDIDGEVLIENNLNYNNNIIGEMKKIIITEADFYDLKAKFCN